MKQDAKDRQQANDETTKEPNVLPATEVKNPNPRANENLKETRQNDENPDTKTGSEITDGEDG